MKNVLVMLALLALTGCALKTQTVALDIPAGDRVVGALKPVVIESVVDARDFMTTPEHSAPRLEGRIREQLGAEGRAKAIAGMPRGPLVTVVDSTVVETVRETVEGVLRSRGYQVVPAAEATPSTPRISVKVTEFWSYMPFNLARAVSWTQQMKAWVATDVVIKSAGVEREFTVAGHGAHIVQMYSPENIQKAYRIAIADYTGKLEAKLVAPL